MITTEPLSHICRDQVVSRCRDELSSDVPSTSGLAWERVVDFPHGSFRMLGSRKSKHLDTDPEWVQDKAYYPVGAVCHCFARSFTYACVWVCG